MCATAPPFEYGRRRHLISPVFLLFCFFFVGLVGLIETLNACATIRAPYRHVSKDIEPFYFVFFVFFFFFYWKEKESTLFFFLFLLGFHFWELDFLDFLLKEETESRTSGFFAREGSLSISSQISILEWKIEPWVVEFPLRSISPLFLLKKNQVSPETVRNFNTIDGSFF